MAWNVQTEWGCIPEPEQHALRYLAELAQTPVGNVPIVSVRDVISLYGGMPALDRAIILSKYPSMTVTPENGTTCTDEHGCINLLTSPILGEVWSMMLLDQAPVGAPCQPPCYFAPVMPNPSRCQNATD